jgi:hypothetical protein
LVAQDIENNSKSDIATLFSKEHLRFIHSRSLSKKPRRNKRESQAHGVWQELQKLISGTDLPPSSPDGLSRTINQHLVGLAVNMDNLWTGNIYSKMLDYLLKILLRLHLAPIREKTLYDRKKAYRKKAGKTSTNTASQLSSSLWRRKYKSLCNSLAKELEKHNGDQTQKGPQAILKTLQRHSSRKPTALAPEVTGGNIAEDGDENLPEGEDLADIMERYIEINKDVDQDDIEEDLELEFGEDVQQDAEGLGTSASSSSASGVPG